MTSATTADILAAWQLIEEHGLTVYNRHKSHWACTGDSTANRGIGQTLAAAVKAWAEAAGVPWPSVKVVQRWACEVDGVIGAAYTTPEGAAIVADIGKCGTVIPCEVVIREQTEGV